MCLFILPIRNDAIDRFIEIWQGHGVEAGTQKIEAGRGWYSIVAHTTEAKAFTRLMKCGV